MVDSDEWDGATKSSPLKPKTGNDIAAVVAVEDDVRRELILKILSSKGYRAESLNETYKIIRKLEEANYKILILDLISFKENPLMLLKKIRGPFPDISIIVLLDSRLIYTYKDKLKQLTNKILLNPFAPEELLDIVGQMLQPEYHPDVQTGPSTAKAHSESNERSDNLNKGIIIPIGGGKGGVGKSIVTANLGAGLARSGKKVIVVDIDLGGPNLHTYYGIKNLDRSLFDFLLRKEASLADCVCPTKIPGLKIIGITENYPGDINIKFNQKLRLMKDLRQLKADFILLDLGSGTSLNVIDYFFISKQGIIVTSPEITSVLNTYSFIKTLLYREMELYFTNKGKKQLLDIVKKSEDPDNDMQIKNIDDLEKELARIDPEAVEALSAVKKQFKIQLLLNMVKGPADQKIGESIQSIVKKYLHIEIEDLGFIKRDNAVEASVRRMTPFLLNSPSSPASFCLKSVLSKITSGIKKNNNYPSKECRMVASL